MQAVIINQTRMLIPQKKIILWVRQAGVELNRLSLNKLLKTHKALKPQEQKVCLVFVSAPAMRRLNKQFRNKNTAADILSFSSESHKEPLYKTGTAAHKSLKEENCLGELVLCPAVIQKKAKQLNFPQWMHYLILHGLLHLLGFEHEQGGRQAQTMYALQDSLFAKLSKICNKNPKGV